MATGREIDPKEVTKAINLIADFCERLPDEHNIMISFSNQECYMDLMDEHGDESGLDSEQSLPQNWPTKEGTSP